MFFQSSFQVDRLVIYAAAAGVTCRSVEGRSRSLETARPSTRLRAYWFQEDQLPKVAPSVHLEGTEPLPFTQAGELATRRSSSLGRIPQRKRHPRLETLACFSVASGARRQPSVRLREQMMRVYRERLGRSEKAALLPRRARLLTVLSCVPHVYLVV